MVRCEHQQVAPDQVISNLQDSQAGAGRHKCVVCAYNKGMEDGQSGFIIPPNEARQCNHHSIAPATALLRLEDSQAGPGRHKCANCAYDRGYRDGQTSQLGASALETESITHGSELDDYIPDEEGRKRVRQHIEYERSPKNRAKAIEIHGTICTACGFDFNAVYGAHFAQSYIEIHHVESITTLGGKPVDPRTDLVPLCSNCHSMVHRQRGKILSVTELRDLLNNQ